MPTKIILIRHGQTLWSGEKRYCGLTDIDLSVRGREQAKKLYQILRKEKIHKVYSSDASRALEFARIVFKGFHIEKIPELRELNFGIFEGLTYQEIMKRYTKIYKKWINDPFNVAIPDSESLKDFKKRVRKIFLKIVSLNKNKVLAIVTHTGPIKIIISSILKSNDLWKIEPDLASINIIELKRGEANIVLFNDTSYLNG